MLTRIKRELVMQYKKMMPVPIGKRRKSETQKEMKNRTKQRKDNRGRTKGKEEEQEKGL
jgi:hypothetical protein